MNETRPSISSMHPGELAHSLESLPALERQELWASLSNTEKSSVLPLLHDELKQGFLTQVETADLASLVGSMSSTNLADVVENLNEDRAQEVIDSLSEESKADVWESLAYNENSVGRVIRRDGVRTAPNRSVKEVLRHIKKAGFARYTDRIFLIDNSQRYLGSVLLGTILEADESMKLSQLPKADGECVYKVDDPTSLVVSDFRKRHFVSAAVVDEQGGLRGRITADEAAQLLQSEADHQFLARAGLDEENDLFAPISSSAKKRAVWLGINLLTAFLAALVIGLFEATVQQVVALAVLMPVVASMGGIAGSQTLTIVIRGLALEKLNSGNTSALLRKELGVAIVNGVLWAIVVGMVAALWFQSPVLSIIIAVAVLVNLLVAAASGLFIPLILQKLSFDPALSGSVVLTTVTDVIGFMTFLGLATIFLI